MCMIPELEVVPGPWRLLPPGIYDAGFLEIEERFGWTSRRLTLLEGFKRGTSLLKDAGCKLAFLDGSFVSNKPVPRDFDSCWDPTGVDASKIDPVFLNFDNERAEQKKKFGGEFFPSHFLTTSRTKKFSFLEYFQIDKNTGRAKGIIRVHL